MINCWLMKSEPSCFSIDDLKKKKRDAWSGVRNYQARNFMRDDMKVGDKVLFYHSSCNVPAVVGIAKVCKTAHPDNSALDPKDEHFDPKHKIEKPIWFCVDVEFVEKFKEPVTLDMIKFNPKLKGIMVTERGSRLSIQPVSEKHYVEILKMSTQKAF